MGNESSKNQQLFSDLESIQRQLVDTQEALQEAKDKFSIIFHEAPDIIIILDRQNGNILDINQAVNRILGYEKEALIGQHFSTLFPPTRGLPKSGGVEQFRIHGVAFEAQQFLRADGSICPMDLTLNIIPWQKNATILITLRDVTDRRRAEIAQQKLIQELDAFAHTVAHDLKAPLTAIMGATAAMQDYDAKMSTKERREFIQFIARNTHKMNNIIEELLLLAETRDKDIEMFPLDMANVVAEALERLSYIIKDRQAEVILPPTWPEALGHGPWVEAIWTNYISNALKYGGEPPCIELGGTVQPDCMVRFWVRDNGAGLTPEQQAQLFTPFTRLSQDRIKGHGVGLSIVQRIVEKLGGEVDVESKVGQGSVFSFTLPVRANPAAQTDSRSAAR